MGIKLDALYDDDHPFIRATDEFGTLMWKKWKNPLYWSDILWELSGNGRRTREVLVELKGMSATVAYLDELLIV